MARLVFGMNQSLHGCVDHTAFAPSPTLFRHFIEQTRGWRAASTVATCMRSCVTGTTISLGADAAEHASAAAWRKQPISVVSRSLKAVGSNASLVGDDLEGAIRELKAERDG